jgi:hypothetical protein
MQAIPNHRAGEIGSSSTRFSANITPSGGKRHGDVQRHAAQQDGADDPAAGKQGEPGDRLPAEHAEQDPLGSGTPAPSFSIRLAATVNAIIAANPNNVIGGSTA